MLDAIKNFLKSTGIAQMFSSSDWWQYLIMYVIIGVLLYLAIVRKFEPLLLMPIAFGMLLANLPGANLIHLDFFFDGHYIDKYVLTALTPAQLQTIASEMLGYITDSGTADALRSFVANAEPDATVISAIRSIMAENITTTHLIAVLNNFTVGAVPVTIDAVKNMTSAELANLISSSDFAAFFGSGGHVKLSKVVSEVVSDGGLLDILYLGVKLGVYPSLIFLGVGAMTDFSPLIANPKSLLMGAGAQLGVFAAFFFALFLGFSPMQAAAIGIIGGADGPTAILVTKELAPELLGAIAIAAYSYMALIPIIQPPFMKLLTTQKEREIKMSELRPVSHFEKVMFPILVTAIVVLLVPDAAPLVGFLMLGNLFNVSGVSDRLSKTAQNELINIVTIFLGVSVGATANAQNFLKPQTIYIICLGLCAFIISTCGGLLTGKIMCKLTGGKINPLIGSAGVSAVPMAARVSQDVGRKADPSNFLLMHAMGPNVAGVIGSAVAAGVFLSFFR